MSSTTHAASIDDWRRERLARLTAPDGWLSLVGLAWLVTGDNAIGSADDNDIVVAGLPAHFGTVTLDVRAQARIALPIDSVCHIDGVYVHDAVLVDDAQPHPTVVRAGDISLLLVRRGDQVGLRIRNANAATREQFLGLDYFPVDAAWRIEAEWHAAEPDQVLEMASVIGIIEPHAVAGTASFERDGQRMHLLPVIETPGDTQFFVVFADRTSGQETYGAARFLYTEPPRDGRIVLDFNKAYNPPCAFTPFATCPMAPPENRLPMRVTAGEKAYRGSAH